MGTLRRLLSRPRLVAELRFVFGGALLGGAVGLVVAFLALPPQGGDFVTAPPGTRWFLAVAPGFGFGWWGGLLWSFALALHARSLEPHPPVARLLPTATWAAAVILATATAVRLRGLDLRWGVVGGLLLGTVAARFLLARAARSSLE